MRVLEPEREDRMDENIIGKVRLELFGSGERRTKIEIDIIYFVVADPEIDRPLLSATTRSTRTSAEENAH